MMQSPARFKGSLSRLYQEELLTSSLLGVRKTDVLLVPIKDSNVNGCSKKHISTYLEVLNIFCKDTSH